MADYIKSMVGTAAASTDLTEMVAVVSSKLEAGELIGAPDVKPDLPIWQHPAFVDMFGRPFQVDRSGGGGATLFTGSRDHSIKLWDLRSHTCEHTLLGHTGSVTCIGVHGWRVLCFRKIAQLVAPEA